VAKKLSETALMLLYLSSSVCGLRFAVVGDRGGTQDLEHLASNVALEASKNLGLPETLAGPTRHVRTRPGVATQSHEGDHPERTVGVAVASTIQSVAVLPPRRRVHGRDPAQRGEGRLVDEAFRIVASGDE
jgi:hypothetical protein